MNSTAPDAKASPEPTTTECQGVRPGSATVASPPPKSFASAVKSNVETLVVTPSTTPAVAPKATSPKSAKKQNQLAKKQAQQTSAPSTGAIPKTFIPKVPLPAAKPKPQAAPPKPLMEWEAPKPLHSSQDLLAADYEDAFESHTVSWPPADFSRRENWNPYGKEDSPPYLNSKQLDRIYSLQGKPSEQNAIIRTACRKYYHLPPHNVVSPPPETVSPPTYTSPFEHRPTGLRKPFAEMSIEECNALFASAEWKESIRLPKPEPGTFNVPLDVSAPEFYPPSHVTPTPAPILRRKPVVPQPFPQLSLEESAAVFHSVTFSHDSEDDGEEDPDVTPGPRPDDIFAAGAEPPEEEDPNHHIRVFLQTHQDEETPEIRGLVLPITSDDKPALIHCLELGTTPQAVKAYEWVIRHGIATGRFPRGLAKSFVRPTVFPQFFPVIKKYVEDLSSPRLSPAVSAGEQAVLRILLLQQPWVEGAPIYGNIALCLSILDPKSITGEAMPRDDTIGSYLDQLKTGVSGIDLGVRAVGIGAAILSIGCQCYTAAMIDWASTPTSVKASIISGIVTSIAAATASIYEAYKITSSVDFIYQGVRTLLAAERFEAGGPSIAKGIIKLIFAGVVACGAKAVGKNVSDIGHAIKGADTIISECDSTLDAIRRWAVSEDDVILKTCQTAFDTNSRLIAQPIGSFVRLEHNSEVNRQIEANVVLAGQLNTIIRAGSDTEAGAARALLTNLTQLSSALISRKTDAAAVGAINQAIRPEPVCINIWGPPGHGKTHFTMKTLIPWLQSTFNLNDKVVNATGIHGDYFPPIADEDIIVIDEFLGTGMEDPWLKVWNALFSQSPMNLDGAFVKNQNPYARFVITIGNVDPSTFGMVGRKYTAEYQAAARTRMFPIHVNNIAHDPNKDRNEQSRHDLRFRRNANPITLDEIKRHLRSRFDNFDQNYRQSLTVAASKFQAATEDPITISINGPPGAGKTTLAHQVAKTYATLLRREVVHNAKTKLEQPAIYVMDDNVVGNEKAFGQFYDLLSPNDMIISTNNIEFESVKPYWLVAKWNGLAHLEYWHSPQLKLPGTYRRLGFNKPVWCNNQYIQYPGKGICIRMENHMLIRDSKHLSSENLFSIIGKMLVDVKIDTSPKFVAVLPELTNPNIDVRLEQLTREGTARYYAMPTATNYVKLVDVSVADLQQAFQSIVGTEVTEDTVAAGCGYLAAHFPNYTARVHLEGIEVVVKGGVYVKATTPDRVDVCASFEDAIDSCTMTYGGRTFGFSVQDMVRINTGSGTQVPTFWTLPSKAKINLMSHITSTWITKKAFLDEKSGAAMLDAKDKFVLRAGQFAQSLFDWFKDHKVLALLSAFGLVIGGLTIGALFKRSCPNPSIGYVVMRGKLLSVTVPGMCDLVLAPCTDCKGWACTNPWCRGAGSQINEVGVTTNFDASSERWQGGGGLQIWTKDDFEHGARLIKRVPHEIHQSETDDEDMAEPTVRQERVVKRTKKRGQLKPERYEEPDDDPRQWTNALSLALNNPTQYRYRGALPSEVDKFQSINTLSMTSKKIPDRELDICVDRVRDATCFVKSKATGLMARGLYVGGNKIVCNTHLFPADDQEGALVIDDDHPTGTHADVVATLHNRDLTLLEFTDKTIQAKKNLVPYFVKDKDIRHVRDIRLVTFSLEKTNITAGRSVMVPTILGSNVSSAIHWEKLKPGQKQKAPAIAVYWAGIGGIPTDAGHCGSAYLSTNQQLGGRRIVALHSIASPAAMTTKGAVCSQEDLKALLEPPQEEFYQAETPVLTPYAHPLRPTRTYVTMEPETSMIKNAEPIKLYDIEETDRFHQIGFSRSAYRPPFNKSDYKRSVFHQWTTLPDECAPAPTTTGHMTPENVAKLATREGKPSLMGTQLSYISFTNTKLNKEWLAAVEEFMIDEYADIFKDWRPLNDHEIKNGVTNPNSPLFGFVNAIDPDKSPGFYGAYLKGTKKGDFFDNTAPPGAKPIFKWAAHEKSVALRERYHLMDKLAQQGISLMDTIEARAKGELLPVDKIAVGKVRLFENVGFATHLLHKKYVAPFQALASKYRFVGDNSYTVGFNPYTESGTLYHKMTRVSKSGEPGDFGRFDKRAHPEIQESTAKVKAEWAIKAQEIPPDSFEANVYRQVFGVLGDQNAGELHVSEGILYVTNGSFNSGCLETNFEDGTMNISMRYYAIIDCAKTFGREFEKMSPLAILHHAKKIHVFYVNGDDINSAIHPSAQHWLNFETLQAAYTRMGMIYDTPNKDGGKMTICDVDDMSFSSRVFKRINETIVVGALKKSSIERLFHWTKSNDPKQLAQNMSVALLEAFFWGKEYYDEMAAEVLKMRKHYLDHTGHRIDVNVESYKRKLAAFIASPTLEWLVTEDLNEHFESSSSVQKYHSSTMRFNESRKCPLCQVLCTNQRSYSRHVINSHPKEDVIVPCYGPFCKTEGKPALMASHKCKFSSDYACQVCSATYRTYEAAANHHLAVHARNVGDIADYFTKVHPDLASSSPASFQSDTETGPTSGPGPSELPRILAADYVKIGRDCVLNHVEFARSIQKTAKKTIYVSAFDPDNFKTPITIDRFRLMQSIGGDLLFGSKSIPSNSKVWEDTPYLILKDEFGFYLPFLDLPALELHQAAATPQLAGLTGGTSAPSGSAGTALTASLPATDNLTIQTEQSSNGASMPMIALDPTPPSVGGVIAGPPPETIGMSGPRLILEDAVRAIPSIVADGTIELTAEAGSVFAELPYGSNINETAMKYILSHEIFTGSFDFTFNFFANAALNGALIIGWQPIQKPSYSINDLLRYPHKIINLQGTCTETETLGDRRSSAFWRNTSELVSSDTRDRPRLVCMVYSQLATFTGDQGPSIRFKILQKLNADFCVNNFSEWYGGEASSSNTVPADYFATSAAMVLDSSKMPTFVPTGTRNLPSCVITEKTGFTIPGIGADTQDADFPDGIRDCDFNDESWRVFYNGCLPVGAAFPCPSGLLDGLLSSKPIGPIVLSSSLDSWVPTTSGSNFWTVDTNVPIAGGTHNPGVCTVWRHTTGLATAHADFNNGTLIFVKQTKDEKFGSIGASLTSFDSVITKTTTRFTDITQGWTRFLFSERPEVESTVGNDMPVMPLTSSHHHATVALARQAASAQIALPCTFDVYSLGTNIGQVLMYKAVDGTDEYYPMVARGISQYAYCPLSGISFRNPLAFQEGSQIKKFSNSNWTAKDPSFKEHVLTLQRENIRLEEMMQDILQRLDAFEEFQGAAMGAIGGGLLQGAGQGVSSWQQNQNTLQQIGKEYGHKADLNNQDWARRGEYNAADYTHKAKQTAFEAALKNNYDSNVRRTHMSTSMSNFGGSSAPRSVFGQIGTNGPLARTGPVASRPGPSSAPHSVPVQGSHTQASTA